MLCHFYETMGDLNTLEDALLPAQSMSLLRSNSVFKNCLPTNRQFLKTILSLGSVIDCISSKAAGATTLSRRVAALCCAAL